MFNSFLGTVTEKYSDSIALDTGSIEWSLIMPAKSIEKLIVNEKTRVYVYLQHQENGMQLFGFTSKKERMLFLDLLKVNGIGPKQAVKILSNIELLDLIGILDAGDAEKLKRVPGIGKVTAQKILLTLKGKLTTEKDFAEPAAAGEYADLVSALTEMGFERRRAETCIANLASEKKQHGDTINENELLRAAIIRLSAG